MRPYAVSPSSTGVVATPGGERGALSNGEMRWRWRSRGSGTSEIFPAPFTLVVVDLDGSVDQLLQIFRARPPTSASRTDPLNPCRNAP